MKRSEEFMRRAERIALAKVQPRLERNGSYAELKKAEKKKKPPEITPQAIEDAMARVVRESHGKAMASMPASVPPHAQQFYGHVAAAGHHAQMMQLAREINQDYENPPGERDIADNYPARGNGTGLKNYGALEEVHRRIAQNHLDAAHKIGSKHPDVWQHLNAVHPEIGGGGGRMLAGPVVGAMHPHGGMHPNDTPYTENGEPNPLAPAADAPDHSKWLKNWSWSLGEPHELAKVPLAPMEPRRISAEQAAHAVADNTETTVPEATGWGDTPSVIPGAPHPFDSRLPAIPAAAAKLRGPQGSA